MDFIYELVKDFPDLAVDSYRASVPNIKEGFKRILIYGMGGNYIAGMLLKEFLRDELKFPIEVYPGEGGIADSRSLIILLSYSGDTKEINHIFQKFKKFKKNMLVISSGGRLINSAKKSSVKFIKLPPYMHQRFTLCYSFFPVLKILEEAGVIKFKTKSVEKIFDTLKKEQKNIEKDAEKLALILKEKTPLFYASDYFYPAAYRMQTSIEEDAKIICHANRIPELFHNELEALPNKNFFPVLMVDKKEISKFRMQYAFFKKHIKHFYEIGFFKYSKKERMFIFLQFADFLGYHLSILKNKRMGQTSLSDKIKKL